jgi:aryl-alcohol dehydrogenase-like predicted oxidoreductase
MIRFVLANDNVEVALIGTTNDAHLVSDIEYAAKGPLDAELLQAASAQLAAAGGGPGQGSYHRGGPTPVL